MTVAQEAMSQWSAGRDPTTGSDEDWSTFDVDHLQLLDPPAPCGGGFWNS